MSGTEGQRRCEARWDSPEGPQCRLGSGHEGHCDFSPESKRDTLPPGAGPTPDETIRYYLRSAEDRMRAARLHINASRGYLAAARDLGADMSVDVLNLYRDLTVTQTCVLGVMRGLRDRYGS